jgi:hypothetical protein
MEKKLSERDLILNQIILERMVELRDEIIELDKLEPIQIEISIELDNKFGSRSKKAREGLYEVRRIQRVSREKREQMGELFMNYKHIK